MGIPVVDIFIITPAYGCAEILITSVMGTGRWNQGSEESKSPPMKRSLSIYLYVSYKYHLLHETWHGDFGKQNSKLSPLP